MGIHLAVTAASGPHRATTRGRPSYHRRHPLHPHHRLPLADLPREYGAPTTVWRRLKWWGEERIWRAALAALDQHGQLDWSMAFLDGSFVPAKKGGEYVGLTRKGKGTKWMLVVDGNGLPLGFHLDTANRAEARLAQQTLDTINVARSRGRPKQRPKKLVADRGYDSRAFRRVLRSRGIRMCIPPKRRPKNWKAKRGRPVVARKDDYRLRFKVERSFAWLGNFHRLLIRWEYHFSVYRSWFTVAVLLLCLRRVHCVACLPMPTSSVT
jgi:transposase